MELHFRKSDNATQSRFLPAGGIIYAYGLSGLTPSQLLADHLRTAQPGVLTLFLYISDWERKNFCVSELCPNVHFVTHLGRP